MSAAIIETKENDMPRVPSRQEPVTPQEVMQAIATQEGGGPLVMDYMASRFRQTGVKGTKAELRRQARADLEMIRHMGTADEYHVFVRQVVDFHNQRLWDAQRGDMQAKYSQMF